MSNNGPRNRIKNDPVSTQIGLDLQEYQISFDPVAFDEFVKSQGIWITHYQAVPDPRGMQSRGDNRDTLSLRPDDSDGFIYHKVGRFQALFSSNSVHLSQKEVGELAVSTAYFTLPRVYPDTGKTIYVSTWDRFFLEDIEVQVVNMQFIESRREGVDRLQYPAVAVEFLIDASGGKYEESKDFQITKDGDIKWISNNRPKFNVKTGRGGVYSIRYRYTPYFVVSRIMHEVRVSQITQPFNNVRYVERMPYQVEVYREHVFRDNNVSPRSTIPSVREQNRPVEGGAVGPIGLPSVSSQSNE